MSRVIKFRAWHHGAKSMASWDVLRNLFFNESVRWPIRIHNAKSYLETITFFEIRNSNIFENDDLEVMQFTGFVDIKGKEVFEGDIVYSNQWNPRRQEVAFDRGSFCLKNDESGYYPDIKYAEQMEVVGNIFENPELLKADQNG